MSFLTRLARQRQEEIDMLTYGDADEEYHLGDPSSITTDERRTRLRGFPVVGGACGTQDGTDPDRIDFDRQRPDMVEPPEASLSPQVHHPSSPRGVGWTDPGVCPDDGSRRIRIYSQRNMIVCKVCGRVWDDRKQEMP